MVGWNDLVAAIALVFVLEGIIPFVSPAGLRRTAETLGRLSDGQLRVFGLVSMALGLLLLTFFHG